MIVPESVKKDWDVVTESPLIQIDKLKKELQSTKEELQSTKEELQETKEQLAKVESYIHWRFGDLDRTLPF